VTRVRRGGYTLVETATTVVIVGLLAGIATAVGLGTFRDMQRSEANTVIETVTAAQLSHAGNAGSYSSDPATFVGLDGVVVTAGASTRPGEVSIAVGSNGSAVMAALNTDRSCSVRVLGDILSGAGRDDFTATDACRADRYLPAGESPTS
jgi:Tfp pilus assembly protein PilE